MDILVEKHLDILTEAGPFSVRFLLRRDDVGYNVSVEASLWQNPRSFKHVTVYSDEGTLEIQARVTEAP